MILCKNVLKDLEIMTPKFFSTQIDYHLDVLMPHLKLLGAGVTTFFIL